MIQSICFAIQLPITFCGLHRVLVGGVFLDMMIKGEGRASQFQFYGGCGLDSPPSNAF